MRGPSIRSARVGKKIVDADSPPWLHELVERAIRGERAAIVELLGMALAARPN